MPTRTWIHYIPIRSHSLRLMNSLKIQWNHLAYKDTFCWSEFKNAWTLIHYCCCLHWWRLSISFWFILSFDAWTLIHCNHVNNDIVSNDSLFILAINFSFVALATLEFHNCWWHNLHHVQMVAELLWWVEFDLFMCIFQQLLVEYGIKWYMFSL